MTKGYSDFPKISFTPSAAIAVGTSTREINIVIELDSNIYGDSAGYDTVFSDATLGTFKSGKFVGCEVTPDTDPDAVILKKGDIAKKVHFKYVYPLHSAFASGTAYSL